MTETFFNRRNVRYFLSVAVSLVTLAVYLSALRNGFVLWDDDVVVFNNIHIRSLDTAFLKWALFDTRQLWQPVMWMSFGLDYLLWGLDPFGYHLTNILIHTANTFISVLLVIRFCESATCPVPNCFEEANMGPGPSTFLSDRTVLISGMVTGILFGLHPLHVEAAAWVSGRNQLLCAFFFILSILSYIDYASGSGSEDSRASKVFSFNRKYVLCLVSFAFAVSSQPLAIVLPAVLLILDWWPFRRFQHRNSGVALFVEKVPFLALSLAVSLLAVQVERTSGSLSLSGQAPFSTRVLVAARALMEYLWKMIVPSHLVPFYPYPENVSFVSPEYFSALMIVVAITAGCIFTAKKRPVMLSVWLYYLMTLLPVIGIIQVRDVYIADRYAYLPGAGLFLLLGLLSAWVWAKVDALKQGSLMLKRVAIVSMISLCIVMVSTTLEQIGIWKNTVTLWSHVIEEEPVRVPGAYLNRGWAFKELKQYDRAISDFNTAIALDRRPPYLAYNNRGVTYKEMGQFDLALEDLSKAISLAPAPYLAYYNRGLVYAMTGLRDEAVRDFTRAIELDPKYFDAFTSRGLLLVGTGQLRRAMEDLDRAVLLNPFSVDAYLNRGVLFEQMEQFDRALADYEAALRLDPSDYLVYANRGLVFEKTGRRDRAIEDLTRAISLNPAFIRAYMDRAGLLQKTGDAALARQDYRRACELGSEAACSALPGPETGRRRP